MNASHCWKKPFPPRPTCQTRLAARILPKGVARARFSRQYDGTTSTVLGRWSRDQALVDRGNAVSGEKEETHACARASRIGRQSSRSAQLGQKAFHLSGPWRSCGIRLRWDRTSCACEYDYGQSESLQLGKVMECGCGPEQWTAVAQACT